jgi:hypothetical protein
MVVPSVGQHRLSIRYRFAPEPKICYQFPMIAPEQLVGEEWAEWYRLTPVQRWLESEKLWQTYLALGGSLDPDPDTQSPFFDARAPRSRPPHGRTGVRVLRSYVILFPRRRLSRGRFS